MKKGKIINNTISKSSLIKLVQNNDIETVITAFPDMYGRLMGKRFDSKFFIKSVLDEGTHACDYLLGVDIDMEPISGYKITSWEKGYGDFHLKLDLNTIRIADWLYKTAIILCDLEKNHNPVNASPREILKKQIKIAEEKGYKIKLASELEFYVFDNSYQEAKEKSYIGLNPSNRFREDYSLLNTSSEEALMAKLRNTLSNSGIEVECTKGEWDLGQQEINVKYSDPLDMADKHVIIKQAAKELAYQNDMSITFMSKWNEKSAGSSMHIHLSLWDLDDSQNLFYDKTVKSDLKSSDHFQWFLGGWMKYSPDIFMFYSPYPASFKRFVSESFAPTKISWSLDNRTSTFRIVGEQNSLRIECRIPGADANPYLAFAASIAAGINGIENKISPPEITKGDSYTNTSLISCPDNIDKGLKYFSDSKFISDHFNQEIKDHYLHFFKTEKFAFERIITDWEKNRYFERI